MPSEVLSSVGAQQRGTASVELVAIVPLVLLAVLAMAQIALAGHAIWSAGTAARAGARAALVGADPIAVARRALPPALRPGARVDGSEGVSVRVRIPALLPAFPELTVGARASLGVRGG